MLKYKEKIIYSFKSLLLAYGITVVFIFIFSLLLTFTNLSESKVPLLNALIMVVAIAAGSIYGARNIKEKGYIVGGVIGIIYYLILILLNFLFLNSFSLMFSITRLVISFIAGAVGGMIGINS